MASRTRFFAGGANGNPYDEKISYITTTRLDLPNGKKRRKDITRPLVVKHPYSDQKGLYFPFYYVAKITGLKEPSRSKQIFNILINSYIGSSGKFYKHEWETGDIILSDQIHSLHRRGSYSVCPRVIQNSLLVS